MNYAVFSMRQIHRILVTGLASWVFLSAAGVWAGPPGPPVDDTPGSATFQPAAPEDCDNLVITYDPTGGTLASNDPVHALISTNDFATSTNRLMSRLTPGGSWIVTNKIQTGTTNLLIIFTDAGETTFDNNGTTGFWRVAVSPCTTSAVSTAATARVRGDFNGDGWGDLAMRLGSTSEVYGVLLLSNAQILVTNKLTANFLPDVGPRIGRWVLAAISDLNADDTEDLIFRLRETNRTLHVAAFMKNGQVTNTAFITSRGTTNAKPWRIVAGGDLNGDGRGELILQKSKSGVYEVGFCNGATITNRVFLFGIKTDISPWRVAAAGDLDGDSRDDLILRRGGELVYAVYFMASNGYEVSTGAYLLGAPTSVDPWKLVATSDMSGQGRSDLLFRYGSQRIYDRAEMTGVFVTDSQKFPATHRLKRWVINIPK